MKTSQTLMATALLAALAAPLAHAASTVVLKENFNNVGSLANWVQANRSSPAGLAWFQGNAGVFAAQTGPADSYIGANYLSAALGSGAIDNWLITPELALGGATHLSFFTRTLTVPGYNDTLEVRYSPGGGTDAIGFSTLLGTIGGASAYPGSWQEFTAHLMQTAATGRFAFRYIGDASVANYIGIDNLTVSVMAVPEPAAWLMLALGLAALPLLRRAQSNR
jgi:hypothetical protein